MDNDRGTLQLPLTGAAKLIVQAAIGQLQAGADRAELARLRTEIATLEAELAARGWAREGSEMDAD